MPTETTTRLATLDAYLDRLLFTSGDGVFQVALCRAGRGERVTVAGRLGGLEAGESRLLRFYGRWKDHPKFGRQFAVEAVVTPEPTHANGIRRYLATAGCKGIGPKTADRLVDAFGEQTLKVLRAAPEQVATLPRISLKAARHWQAFFAASGGVEQILVWLLDHDMDASLARRLYEEYGTRAIAKVKEKPYQLVTEFWGVGFRTADRLALSLGWSRLGHDRLLALWRHLLQEALATGDCYRTTDQLFQAALDFLEDDRTEGRKMLENIWPQFAEDRELAYDAEANRWALEVVAHTERRLAQRLLAHPHQMASQPVDWAWLEERVAVTYAPAQREALTGALQSGFAIITGGPGTGKTTILRGLLTWLQEHEGMDSNVIALAAPTARAAKRMEEVTGHPATTIHRLLGAGGGGYGHDDANPLPFAVLVVDESSMIDVFLAWALWKAVAPTTRVLWVGDHHQLPSVGPGAVLRDLMQSQRFAVHTLTQNFRSGSHVASGAHAILAGRPPATGEDFTWTEWTRGTNKAEVQTALLTMLQRLLAVHSWDDIQVLAPIRRGLLGTDALNEAIRELVNPLQGRPDFTGVGGRTYRVGDRVIQLANHYGKGVLNGDIGVVRKIVEAGEDADGDETSPQLLVAFSDDVAVTYTAAETRHLALAYATTVHKAQGSEYPVVVLPVFWDSYRMLTRNLLYTAVTRAKARVALLTEAGAVGQALRTAEQSRRQTALTDWMDASAQPIRYR